MATFAIRVKELRVKNELTQSQLAEAAGVTKQTVSLWERGMRKPSFEALDNLSEVFKVSIAYIQGQSHDDSPVKPITDDAAARWAAEEDDEELTNMASQIAQLSYEMRRLVWSVVREAVRVDREREQLLPAEDHKVRVKTRWVWELEQKEKAERKRMTNEGTSEPIGEPKKALQGSEIINAER